MAIIPEINLFDYLEINELGDLERLKLALEGIDDEDLMRRLEARRGHGRNDYPVRVMWNLFIAMKIFEHKGVASFRRELSRNSQLRNLCGLKDYDKKKYLVPPARVFTGFLNILMDEQKEIDKIFDEQVSQFFDILPGFGENMAGDGKYLDSYAKRKPKEGQTSTDNRTENDAEWSVKKYEYYDKNGKLQVKKEYHFGFKVHMICCAKYEFPMAYSVTAGNADEKKEILKLLQCPVMSMEKHREIMKYLILDRGYDSSALIKFLKDKGISPVVDIRNCWKDGEDTKQYKDTDIVYNYKGEVFYMEDADKRIKMKYEGYDKQKKCLRYSHKGKIYKIYTSYDERVFLPIARDSEKFKKLYKKRTSVERLNGRLDRDYFFEDHYIRGLRKMRLLASLSLVVMNGIALGKLRNGYTEIRSLKKIA